MSHLQLSLCAGQWLCVLIIFYTLWCTAPSRACVLFTVYSYRKQMQEMEKYKRFCRVCCDPLDRKYALLTVSGQLTTVGQVVVQVSELSIGHLKECNAHVYRTCYRSASALKKMEDDVTTRSRAMGDKISAATTFFASFKRVMEMSSPMPLSPSSALRSPLPKRLTSDSTTAVTSVSRALFASSTLQVGTASQWETLKEDGFTLASWKAHKGVLSTEDTLQGIHLVWRKLQRCL